MATNDVPARAWEVGGRYGTWYVDEYHPREAGRGVYDSLNVPTRKLAEKVASLLNNAYADGRVTGWAEHEEYEVDYAAHAQAAQQVEEDLSTWRTESDGSRSGPNVQRRWS